MEKQYLIKRSIKEVFETNEPEYKAIEIFMQEELGIQKIQSDLYTISIKKKENKDGDWFMEFTISYQEQEATAKIQLELFTNETELSLAK